MTWLGMAPAILALLLSGCGYRVSGKADLLPSTVRTIALPAFDNLTNRYKLSEQLPGAIARELISRTRYSVVENPDKADAVLRGSVTNYMRFPNVTDPVTGRATAVQISVILSVSLVERETGKVLYQRPSMEFRQRYEISVDQSTYFEESDVALERLSREVARSLVSSVLENF